MALLDLHPGRRLSGALMSLLETHPATLFSLGAERRRTLDFQDRMARMPAHLLDDIGVKDQGAAPKDGMLKNIVTSTAAMRS